MPEFRQKLIRLRRLLRALVHRRALEDELEVELRFHVELEAEELVRAGVPAGEARRRARLAFGGVERFKEEARDARGVRWLEDLARDLHGAARQLRGSPGFTIAAALSLAIGIAATTVVFSAVNALLLRPLPVAEPERLFVVQESGRGPVETVLGLSTFSYDRYLAYREATDHVFAGLAAQRLDDFSLRASGEARILGGVVASGNYFQVLGVRPALGRFFGEEQDRPGGAEPVAVISHDLWQREFGGDPVVLGSTLHVNSRPLTVIGVAPRGFGGTIVGIAAEVWIPAAAHRLSPLPAAGMAVRAAPRPISMTNFARLKPGISRAQAEAVLEVVGPQVPVEHPEAEILGVRLEPLASLPAEARGPVTSFMAMLAATAVLVLLIAATNVAGMLLARAAVRQREVAVRLAIGAGRARLVRQFVTETLVLFLLGGGAGVVLASWLTQLIATIQPPLPVRVALDFGLDARVLVVAIAGALGTGLLAGLAPALQATRMDLTAALKTVGPRLAARGSRLRGGFVVAQLAMSLVLLVTAGLFARALQSALAVDPGFEPQGVVVAQIGLAAHGYDEARGRAFFRQLLERMEANPEIASASLAYWAPLTGMVVTFGAALPEWESGRELVEVQVSLADVGYFETMRVPIMAGRAFATADGPESTPAVIVNQTLARRLWPDASAVGQRLVLNGLEREVVGIAQDGKYRSLHERPVAHVYASFSHWYAPRRVLHVRARHGAGPALAAIRREVATLDPNIALAQAMPLPTQLGLTLMPQRIAAWLIGAFGLVGVVLAAIGVHGVVAYHVAQRTREFGIRIALGARGAQLVRGVLRHTVVLVAIGALVGAVAALGVGRFASSFLFGVSAADPVIFLTVPALLAIVALLASYGPARRAARVDPMVSLRAE